MCLSIYVSKNVSYQCCIMNIIDLNGKSSLKLRCLCEKKENIKVITLIDRPIILGLNLEAHLNLLKLPVCKYFTVSIDVRKKITV
jgi:hypothetical protein